MFCEKCRQIRLDFAPDDRDGKEEIQTEIRTYTSVYDLRDSAASCDFCGMIYEEARSLETDEIAPYCKQKWGKELSNHLLAQSMINVYLVYPGRQNIIINCQLNAQEAPDYTSGPIAYVYEAVLGGLYVQPGEATWLFEEGDEADVTRRLYILRFNTRPAVF